MHPLLSFLHVVDRLRAKLARFSRQENKKAKELAFVVAILTIVFLGLISQHQQPRSLTNEEKITFGGVSQYIYACKFWIADPTVRSDYAAHAKSLRNDQLYLDGKRIAALRIQEVKFHYGAQACSFIRQQINKRRRVRGEPDLFSN